MQAWCTGWWNAEREEALRQLDDILDAEGAWLPAPALWGSAPSDGLEEPSAEEDDDEPRHAPHLAYLHLVNQSLQHLRHSPVPMEDPHCLRLSCNRSVQSCLTRIGQ